MPNPGRFRVNVLRFFRRFCCFNDHRESVSFQGCTANQRAIDVWLGEQLSSVACVYGTAVLDDNLFSDFRVSFSNVVTDEFVNSLSLRWGCRFAGTDRPYWFVSDDCAFEGCCALSFQNRVDLACANFFGFARFVFCFGFTDAQYWDQTLFFQNRESARQILCGRYDARSGR